MSENTHLNNRSVLKVSGPDAISFLQGLVTQDIALLETQDSIYTGLLSPQGKILFDFFIFKIQGSYFIDCDKGQSDDLFKRLSMYKLHAEIDLTDETKTHSVLINEVSSDKMPADPRCPLLGGRIVVSDENKTDHPQALSHYNEKRFNLGIADSCEIGTGKFFPHECNFDLLQGLSFTKGCYVGQEVVSRMEHRGTVRNRILPYHSLQKTLETDTEIRCGDKKLGTVISAQNKVGLAIIRFDRLAQNDPHTPIFAGEIQIELLKPEWASFDMPHLKDLPA